MKVLRTIPAFLGFAALGLLLPACATKNVNPVQAQPHTGYVDFYTEPPSQLSWDVSRFDDRTQSLKRVYYEYEPIADGVLRLAFAPGHYRLQATFLNRTVLEPIVAEVNVNDGMVTPVHVEFSDAETSTVETKRTSVGGTVYGRRGRRTKFETSENTIYRAKAMPQTSQPYRPKQQMPYAH